ncbi:phospholipase D-like domain-containing protein [Halocatena salina]|uniref:Phospholipase D-like domain-containing protein n=1 Tax=Halocatena salina TaxID=2934340 RepID=A0A8U0A5Y3_9EURY|nr:phospholipase D-like domain-containing protein [Halocatena salina]UPM43908.1 phospholipase D-like domain-containing protein [Halocatena salina]
MGTTTEASGSTRRSRAAGLACTILAVVIVGSTLTGVLLTVSAEQATGTDAEIVGVYPNPVTEGDAGEFIVIDVPTTTNVSGWQLRDGESNASLPTTTVSGRVVLSTEPSAAQAVVDGPVQPLTGRLTLANSGERLRLVRNNASLDTVEYDTAPEGERYQRDGERWEWQPLGHTDFSAFETGSTSAKLFVLPDTPDVPLATLDSATDRILIGGYTFTSEAVATRLIRAHRRGVHVEVLVDGGPVGGISTHEATVLDRLSDAGIDVHVLSGERARYAHHHAKYGVVDNRSLVMTENWKPSGVGGQSSRGWGAIVDDAALTDRLAAVFRADTGWNDTTPWSEFRRNETFEPGEQASGSYPSEIDPDRVPVEQVRFLVAPDNAESEVIGLIDNATETIRVVQVSTAGPDGPFTKAVLRAAQRGVDVRILLDSTWYVREENSALVEHLTRVAADQDLPLEAQLAEPNGRYEKIHAKGMIIDGKHVVVGSLNWNEESARENREALLVLTGEAVGSYYEAVFDADWTGGTGDGLPVGIIAAIGILLIVALVLAKTLDFERGQ